MLNIALKQSRMTFLENEKKTENKKTRHVQRTNHITRQYDMDMVIFDYIVYYFEVEFSEQFDKV